MFQETLVKRSISENSYSQWVPIVFLDKPPQKKGILQSTFLTPIIFRETKKDNQLIDDPFLQSLSVQFLPKAPIDRIKVPSVFKGLESTLPDNLKYGFSYLHYLDGRISRLENNDAFLQETENLFKTVRTYVEKQDELDSSVGISYTASKPCISLNLIYSDKAYVSMHYYSDKKIIISLAQEHKSIVRNFFSAPIVEKLFIQLSNRLLPVLELGAVPSKFELEKLIDTIIEEIK